MDSLSVGHMQSLSISGDAMLCCVVLYYALLCSLPLYGLAFYRHECSRIPDSGRRRTTMTGLRRIALSGTLFNSRDSGAVLAFDMAMEGRGKETLSSYPQPAMPCHATS